MIEADAGYIPQNPDGTFTVPRPLMHLVRSSAGTHFNRHNPTFIRFNDTGNPDEVFAEFEGELTVAQSILDTAWVYGTPFLNACGAGRPIKEISESYQTAVMQIRQLGKDS